MEQAKGIVWLASYPKSGNTWFRIFLCNLLSEPREKYELDSTGFAIASSRTLFDEVAGIDSSDMTFDEIDSLRPRVYEQIVAEARRLPVFMKTHDAYTYLPSDEPLMSCRATAGAIYIIRNPLDVAVSFAYHLGVEDFEKVIARMNSSTDAFAWRRHRLEIQLRQKMMGWSLHAKSWLEQQDFPVHVMRYEDMKSHPLESFTAAVRYSGLDHTEDVIQQALDSSNFERLQKLEEEQGFRERSAHCRAFFREGKVGSWRSHLSEEQASRIMEGHGEMMRRFGYPTCLAEAQSPEGSGTLDMAFDSRLDQQPRIFKS